ncbi:MAG TPA: universal stress protein [Longimicrobiales bacterium]|nr:universal stress protein [Longimicrobiales bacterium]
MKIENILVPLDGSGFGEQALPVAISIVRRTGCGLTLVHVQAPLPFAPEGIAVKPLEEASERYLSAVEGRLAQAEAFDFTTELLHGPVEAVLAERIEASGVDLVVMATHGKGPFSRFWLGSVTDALIRRVTCPVLLVRPSEEDVERPGHEGFRHVLVPLDGSAAAEQVLEPATTLGAVYDARYTLLRVATLTIPLPLIEDPGSLVPMLEKQEKERATTYLAQVAEPLRERGLSVETTIPSAVHPAEGILSYATRNLVDLVAVTTQGSGGVNRGRMGSVADKVIRGSEAPVLVLKPEAASG